MDDWAKAIRLAKYIHLINLRKKMREALMVGDMIQEDNVLAIKAFDLDANIEEGMEVTDKTLRDIEEMRKLIYEVKEGANRIAEYAQELY